MPTPTEGLRRDIGRWDLVALAINGIVGAGIFGLPAKAYALAGSWSLIAFVACALLALCIALCFAEVGSRYSATGGPYLYAREALGAPVGFAVGWLWWVSRIASYAANLNLAVSYTAFLLPALNDPRAHAAAIIGVTLALLTLNIVGVRDSTLASNLFTIGKLGALSYFVIAGLPHVDPTRLTLTTMPSIDNLSTAVLLLVYAFTGFEMVAVPAGEVRDPQHALPRALLIAISAVAVLYLGIQIVCVGTLPGLAQSTRPLADAAQHFAGSLGATIIVLGAVVSNMGNLNIVMLSSSRIPFAMATQHDLPQFLATTHARFQTPHWSLIATATAAVTLSLSRSFLAALTISSTSRLVAYAATAVALWRLRQDSSAPPARFYLPAGKLIAGITIVLTVWLLLHTTPAEGLQAALLAAAGLLLYVLARRRTLD